MGAPPPTFYAYAVAPDPPPEEERSRPRFPSKDVFRYRLGGRGRVQRSARFSPLSLETSGHPSSRDEPSYIRVEASEINSVEFVGTRVNPSAGRTLDSSRNQPYV